MRQQHHVGECFETSLAAPAHNLEDVRALACLPCLSLSEPPAMFLSNQNSRNYATNFQP